MRTNPVNPGETKTSVKNRGVEVWGKLLTFILIREGAKAGREVEDIHGGLRHGLELSVRVPGFV